jgi:hypothetical protein
MVQQLIDNDIVPIILNAPPTGSADVPLFNAWLLTKPWRVIDIFTSLVDVDGVTLKAAMWDGNMPRVHWTDTGLAAVNGHLTVLGLVQDYIATEAL